MASVEALRLCSSVTAQTLAARSNGPDPTMSKTSVGRASLVQRAVLTAVSEVRLVGSDYETLSATVGAVTRTHLCTTSCTHSICVKREHVAHDHHVAQHVEKKVLRCSRCSESVMYGVPFT